MLTESPTATAQPEAPGTHSQPAEPRLRTATVLCASAGRYLLAGNDGQIEAERAPSCLIEPTTGDRVLAAEADGAAFVLAVLRRDEAIPARIDVPGGLEVRAPRGRVLLAGEKVELAASAETTMTTPKMSVSALEGKFFVDKLSMIGARIDAEIGKLSAVADTIDTVADRVRQRCERYYRIVKGIDHTRAGTIDMKAEGHARVHAYDTVVTADKLVKIDGSQIHVG
jgi:hypothetical protein